MNGPSWFMLDWCWSSVQILFSRKNVHKSISSLPRGQKLLTCISYPNQEPFLPEHNSKTAACLPDNQQQTPYQPSHNQILSPWLINSTLSSWLYKSPLQHFVKLFYKLTIIFTFRSSFSLYCMIQEFLESIQCFYSDLTSNIRIKLQSFAKLLTVSCL